MKVLGIDPGSLQTGYGIIDENNRVHGFGAVAFSGDHIVRVKAIYHEITRLVKELKPDTCGIEMPVYGRNPQAMLKLGRAQAAAMLAVLNQGVSVTQYTPKMVKRSVTGNGNASKQQVTYMVSSLLEFGELNHELTHDASDALAVAFCHKEREVTGKKSGESHYNNWAAFVRANPDRVSGH